MHEGLIVVIYMTDELEVQARLRQEQEYGDWIAEPIWETIIYLDGTG